MGLLSAERCKARDICDAQLEVREVVVNLAKTPLKAAQAPLAAAMGSHAGVEDRALAGRVEVREGDGGGESLMSR